LHSFIQGGGLSTGKIQLGDWIDLKDGLTVAAYGTGGDSGAITGTGNTDLGGTKGKLLRLIVVGINSFQSGRGMTAATGGTETMNGDTNGLYQPPSGATVPPHVVLQFQNIPVTRRMDPLGLNAGGYAVNEMRKYLVQVEGEGGNFLTGLTNAGVPENVLWAPTRRVSTKSGTATEISDYLWLPTVGEMCGAQVSSEETAGNQARLEYYNNDNKRIKYKSGSTPTATSYWEASSSDSSTSFYLVTDKGKPNNSANPVQTLGVAPAFCVK
jgi:hypothetical protein